MKFQELKTHLRNTYGSRVQAHRLYPNVPHDRRVVLRSSEGEDLGTYATPKDAAEDLESLEYASVF